MPADTNLDDLDLFRKLDTQNMLGEIDGLPDQLKSAWDLGQTQPLPDIKNIQRVVITGMGSSAIGAISYMIPRVGIAASIITLVAGQLLMGTILDHFGLLGAAQRSLEITRAVGLVVVLLGVWLTVK